jgi:double-stranded uracil-DNA glycosylase
MTDRRDLRRAELEAARHTVLPDLIADDLTILFVGINPGLSSAADQHHFATPGNRLWPALHRAGFTPRLLRPDEEQELLGLGLGITSIVRRPTVGVRELTRTEYVEGGRRLRERVLARRPAWLAMLGVTGYRAAFAVPDAVVGLQPETIGTTRVWVVPNPSGLNAHYPPAALAEEFRRLRVAAGLPDLSGS